MKIAVIGAGSLGVVFAAFLQRAGHEVVLVGRRSLETLLAESGSTRTVDDSTMRIRIRGCERLDLRVSYATSPPAHADLLLLCTKALDTRSQLAPLSPAVPRSVLSLQNSIRKNTYLAEAFAPETVLGGATMVSAERRPEGVVWLTTLGNTFVGPACTAAPALGPFAEEVALAFTDAGLPAVFVPESERLEWTKACFVAGGFAVATITGLAAGRFFPDPDLARAFLAVAREVAAIAMAAGWAVADYPGLPIRTLLEKSEEDALAALNEAAARFVAAPFPVKPSMLQDLEAGRPLETEENLGALLEEAAGVGVAVPCLEMALHLIRGLARAGMPTDD